MNLYAFLKVYRESHDSIFMKVSRSHIIISLFVLLSASCNNNIFFNNEDDKDNDDVSSSDNGIVQGGVLLPGEEFPSLALTGLPTGDSTARAVTVAIDAVAIESIRYGLQRDHGDCSESTYGDWVDSQSSIDIQVGFPGPKRFCIEGRTAAGEVFQQTEIWTSRFRYGLQLSSMTHPSEDAPLLSLENDSSDCRSSVSDGPNAMGRRDSSFIRNNEINLAIVCGGTVWSYTTATWDGKTATASWNDADDITPGYQTDWQRGDLSNDGTTRIGNPYGHYFQILPDDSLIGFYATSSGGPSPRLSSGVYPMYNSDYSTTTASDIYTTRNWWHETDAGGWNNNISFEEYWLMIDGDHLRMYFRAQDSSSRRALGVATGLVADFPNNISFPDTYLVKDYQIPMVRKYGDTYHMIAYSVVRTQWEHVIGSDYQTFDWDNATDLELDNIMTVGGKWFSADYEYTGGVSEPRIGAFEILEVDGAPYAFLFYRAGDHYTDTAVSVRGFGVIRIPLRTD